MIWQATPQSGVCCVVLLLYVVPSARNGQASSAVALCSYVRELLLLVWLEGEELGAFRREASKNSGGRESDDAEAEAFDVCIVMQGVV